VGGEQPPADPVQRVALAAAVPGADPSADLVEGGVGEADHMEVINHEAGLGQRVGTAVAYGR
jgi:hypothetical protein